MRVVTQEWSSKPGGSDPSQIEFYMKAPTQKCVVSLPSCKVFHLSQPFHGSNPSPRTLVFLSVFLTDFPMLLSRLAFGIRWRSGAGNIPRIQVVIVWHGKSHRHHVRKWLPSANRNLLVVWLPMVKSTRFFMILPFKWVCLEIRYPMNYHHCSSGHGPFGSIWVVFSPFSETPKCWLNIENFPPRGCGFIPKSDRSVKMTPNGWSDPMSERGRYLDRARVCGWFKLPPFLLAQHFHRPLWIESDLDKTIWIWV